MPGTLTATELELTHGTGAPPPPAGAGGGEGGGAGGAGVPARAYYTGISLALAGILMFFMALVSSFIVRKADAGWQPVQLPPLLWLNTLALVASSMTLERARIHLKNRDARLFARWWGITTLLGLLFLAGQVAAWAQMRAAGVFLASNPSSSFFYLLTGAHALHLVGGVGALAYVALRGWGFAKVTQDVAADVTGIYWHFMDGLWVFLLLILYFGR